MPDQGMVELPEGVKRQLLVQLQSILAAQTPEAVMALVLDTRGLLKGAAILLGVADEHGSHSFNAVTGQVGPPLKT